MDSGSIDWKGLKKSARSLKFVGREMGGVFKGGLGDVMGVATAGIGMGKLGGAMAVGAIGTNMVMEHFAEERRKQEEKQGQAFSTMQGGGNTASGPRSTASWSRLPPAIRSTCQTWRTP